MSYLYAGPIAVTYVEHFQSLEKELISLVPIRGWDSIRANLLRLSKLLPLFLPHLILLPVCRDLFVGLPEGA